MVTISSLSSIASVVLTTLLAIYHALPISSQNTQTVLQILRSQSIQLTAATVIPSTKSTLGPLINVSSAPSSISVRPFSETPTNSPTNSGYQSNSPWPHFRGNNLYNGASKYSGPSSAQLKWRYLTGSYVQSSPAIDGNGNLYVGSDDHYFYCLRSTGSFLWRFHTGSLISSSPAIASDGSIYFGSQDYYIYSLTPKGSLKWRFKTGSYVYSSPAVARSGNIYVGSHDYALYALDSYGSLLWMHQTNGNIDSPIAIDSNGNIYVGSHDNNLYVFTSFGSTLWKFETSDAIYSSVALTHNNSLYLTSCDGNLYAIDISGSLNWKYQTLNSIYSSPAVDTQGNVHFLSYSGYLYSLSSTGSVRWTYSTLSTGFSSPLIASNGVTYVGSMDGYIYAFTPAGSLVWKYYTSSIDSSPSLGADGTLYVSSSSSYIYAFSSSVLISSDSPILKPSSRPISTALPTMSISPTAVQPPTLSYILTYSSWILEASVLALSICICSLLCYCIGKICCGGKARRNHIDQMHQPMYSPIAASGEYSNISSDPSDWSLLTEASVARVRMQEVAHDNSVYIPPTAVTVARLSVDTTQAQVANLGTTHLAASNSEAFPQPSAPTLQ